MMTMMTDEELIAVELQKYVEPLEWVNGEAKGIGDIIYSFDIDQEKLAQGKTVWEAWYGWSHEHEYCGDPIDIGTSDTKEGAMALANLNHAVGLLRYLTSSSESARRIEDLYKQYYKK